MIQGPTVYFLVNRDFTVLSDTRQRAYLHFLFYPQAGARLANPTSSGEAQPRLRPEMDQKATILCIDDEEPGRMLRKLLLESAGYDVLTAASGREGLQIFRSQPVDAVIVDYWMADMNGLAVAKELRRLNRKTPIIVLSAYVPILDEAVGLADLWVRKGEENPDFLLGKLKELLEKRQQN